MSQIARVAMSPLKNDAVKETPASRFIRAAENWIASSAVKYGVHTPVMDQHGTNVVLVDPLEYPANRRKVAEFVIAHLGKLADLLKVAIVFQNVKPEERKLYNGYQDSERGIRRLPSVPPAQSRVQESDFRRWMNAVVI